MESLKGLRLERGYVLTYVLTDSNRHTRVDGSVTILGGYTILTVRVYLA